MNFVSTPVAQLVMHAQCEELLLDKCKESTIDYEKWRKLNDHYEFGSSRPSSLFTQLGTELAGSIYKVRDPNPFKITIFLIENRPKKVYKIVIMARPEGSEELFEKIYLAVQVWIESQNS